MILGPIEALSIYARTGKLPTRMNNAEKQRIINANLLLPTPSSIKNNEAGILKVTPCIDKQVLEDLHALGLIQESYSVIVNNRDSRRKRARLENMLVAGKLPARSIAHVRGDIYIPCPALALILLARMPEASDEELVFAASELCSQYAYEDSNHYNRGIIGRIPHTTVAHIDSYLDAISKLNCRAPRGAHRLRNVLRYVHGGTRSPREIACGMFMQWEKVRGGLGVSPFEVNKEIELTEQEQRELEKGHLEVDFIWKASKTVLEYNGGVHNDRREEDSKRINVLRDKGYNVAVLSNSVLSNYSSFMKFMKRLEEPLGFVVPKDADTRNVQQAFQQRVLAIANHQGVLKL